MRKYIVLICILVLLLAAFQPFRLDKYTEVDPVHFPKTTFVEGITENDSLNMCTSQISLTRYIKDGYNVLGYCQLEATFLYDCITPSKAYSYKICETEGHYGWELHQLNTSIEGNTITFHMELRKFFFRIPCSITFTCDPEGNITYS